MPQEKLTVLTNQQFEITADHKVQQSTARSNPSVPSSAFILKAHQCYELSSKASEHISNQYENIMQHNERGVHNFKLQINQYQDYKTALLEKVVQLTIHLRNTIHPDSREKATALESSTAPRTCYADKTFRPR